MDGGRYLMNILKIDFPYGENHASFSLQFYYRKKGEIANRIQIIIFHVCNLNLDNRRSNFLESFKLLWYGT